MTTTPIIVGYQYPDADAAQAVFDTCLEHGEQCSVYRTCTPERTEWFVLGVFDTYDVYQRIDWRDGEPINLDAEQRDWLLARRTSAKFLAGVGAIPTSSVTHHDGALRMPGQSRPASPAQKAAERAAAKGNAWYAKNRADGGVCDFCSHLLGDGPVVTYVTDEPIIGMIVAPDPSGDHGVIYDVNDPYWDACPDCDPVIAQGDAALLAAHVWRHADQERIGAPAEQMDSADEVARVTKLYEQFFARNPVRHEGAISGPEDE